MKYKGWEQEFKFFFFPYLNIPGIPYLCEIGICGGGLLGYIVVIQAKNDTYN